MSIHESTVDAIVESATDAIVTADSKGVIVTWNPAATRMFGFEREEAIGEPLTLLVPERFRDAHRAGLARVSETGETRIIGTTVHVAGIHKEGREFPIELSLATWITDGDRYYSGIIRDVSEREMMAGALPLPAADLAGRYGSARSARSTFST